MATPDWTSLTAPKTTCLKFQNKARATGFPIIRLLDVAADLLDKLTPSEIADHIAKRNIAAAKPSRKSA